MDSKLRPVLERATPALGLYASCVLSSALLIVSTRKRSPLRLLWTAPLAYVAYHFCLVASSITTSFTVDSILTGQGMIGLLQCFNLLVIAPVDDEDLIDGTVYTSSTAFATKVGSVFALLINYRGIGTPWQAKGIPPFPNFYMNGGSSTRPSRAAYLVRQGLIVAWQCLFLDIVQTSNQDADPEASDRLFGPGSEYMYLHATPEHWVGRFLVGAMAWFGPGRTVLDISSRIFCVLFVALGILNPSSCPPTFGSMADAYTIRGFWSKLWHQFLRWPLTSISNFLTRDVLRLSRPSILERYTNIYFVFLGSGVFHLVHSAFMGVPVGESNAVIFFSSFAFGIMIEDGVQEAWRRLSGESAEVQKLDRKTPLWQKVVGFIWVIFWLMMTSPWYLYSNTRLPKEVTWILPASIVEKVGMNMAVAALAVGGILLNFAIAGEL